MRGCYIGIVMLAVACDDDLPVGRSLGDGDGDGDVDGGATNSDAGMGDAGGGGGALKLQDQPYVATDAPNWTENNLAHTLAVAQDTVFATDGSTIFSVTDGVVTVYLTYEEIQATLDAVADPHPATPIPIINSLDTDAEGRLYMQVELSGIILRSAAAHEVEVLRDYREDPLWDSLFFYLAVQDEDHMFFVKTDGMFEGTPEGLRLVDADLSFDNCLNANLSVDRDGFLFYLPGCSASPLLGRPAEGGPFVELIGVPDDIEDYLVGMGRAWDGGVIVLAGEKVHHLRSNGELAPLFSERELFYFSHVIPTRGASGRVYLSHNTSEGPTLLVAR